MSKYYLGPFESEGEAREIEASRTLQYDIKGAFYTAVLSPQDAPRPLRGSYWVRITERSRGAYEPSVIERDLKKYAKKIRRKLVEET